ncbi:hypothetical protein JHK87_031603 [Glycine soja]|nr:hypothetical protein JHK87_031603 [Glycine soja]
MQLRFQLQGRSSVTKGKQGRVKETEGVLNGAALICRIGCLEQPVLTCKAGWGFQ